MLNLQEAERASLVRMLNLSVGDSSGGRVTDPLSEASTQWKVLVYDKSGKDVIAPLLKIGALRHHGVTLYLQLDDNRQAVSNVPVVYFIDPTRDNIDRLVNDCCVTKLYDQVYVNFTSRVSDDLLKYMAGSMLEKSKGNPRNINRIAKVVDRYCAFVALSPSTFSLNMPGVYSKLHSKRVTDEAIEECIDRIVNGLLSMLVTIRQIPIIRAPPESQSGPSTMVAERLHSRLMEMLQSGNQQVGSRVERPVLILLDRDMDLATMLHHTWTYQALAHDLFDLNLNTVKIPIDDGDAGSQSSGSHGGSGSHKTYDLDSSDAFFVDHANMPFPAVASDVSAQLQEYNKKLQEVRSKEGGAGKLSSAINALPQMTEMKRSLDEHTNIASAMLKEIQLREINKYYEAESGFGSQGRTTGLTALMERLSSEARGTPIDKLRAALVFVLRKPTLTVEQTDAICARLKEIGADSAAVEFIRSLQSMRRLTLDTTAIVEDQVQQKEPQQASFVGTDVASGFATFANKFASQMQQHGEGLLTGLKNLKNLLPMREDTLITRIVSELMEQSEDGKSKLAQDYEYFDPRASTLAGESRSRHIPRVRGSFHQAIVFMVGGGNYIEQHTLSEWASSSRSRDVTGQAKSVIYGATDFVSPSAFCKELETLGMEK
ncbi:STXBP/UNC-18/SEC1 syntaxin involved in golgi transport, putative [Perkinsus marinus ATCC 50983]|uniref:STXBP/UNC-18/SEC1 syntaxin involved in golgi transport, putative n=1 Tax=Perkinsus marinus (strain ATCC 50983 / TXsc) TaxID=423536 RepID=C5LC87_PERM5|nr:STXBP/UNC-18/SEC1 syntaxin involved in golgi transport, putative [Perkinsus marinus ATCC 50983]EER05570.1 STXBP/UNC-18/SEC1 syntaxin involved in golgi transport, putative [Perkinsus marinus ATCC 50983]|eukprot:XP_002773754.1 STXBP/UNC-18/SEC1 syntaxin involved in golgi transport, putative [Perkinsus marinus ATCC 50983]